MQGAILNTSDALTNKTDKNLCHHRADILVGRKYIKES